MNAQQLAFGLLGRLSALTGSVVVVQADLVLCEDHKSVMCYLYDAAGDCVALCFDIPPGGYDPVALTAALEGLHGTVH